MPGDFRCKACGAEFDTKDKLDQHNRQQHPGMTPGGETTPPGT